MAASSLSMAECLAMASGRRFRGLGKGRKTRRALERGGAGPAAQLNRALGEWPGVRITPMFGRWGYFAGARLFACFPLRDKDADLWIRLTPLEQARALREDGVRPHRRFAARGWIELDVRTEGDVPQALRWLRRARAASATAGDEED
jgi:luciferase-like monooxygenase